MKTVVILQSNYVPWKGYFDLMHEADEFILYDEVQFTKNDWRNRNQLKAASGRQWLSIPVRHQFGQRIDATEVADDDWAVSHWHKIAALYRKAPGFRAMAPHIEALYRGAAGMQRLSQINRHFLEGLAAMLGLRTPLTWSTDYDTDAGKTERLVSLCRAAGATRYLSGPSARDYIDASQFEAAGIELAFKNYAGYPTYAQQHPPFEHGVSVLDLLFHVAHDAPWYIWGWRERPAPP